MKKRTIIVISTVMSLSTSACPAYKYRKDGYLPPVKFTYNDLNRILSALRSQVPVTSEDLYEGVHEQLTISGDGITITKESDPILSDADRLPGVARVFSYSYGYPKGKITRISVDFNEETRYISIEGPSADSVDAVHAFLNQQFLEHKITIGGKKFRTIGGIILTIIAAAFWITPYFVKKTRLMISCPAIGLVIYLSVFLLPFRRWFPGFAIYKDSASFTVRHSACITLLGVILSVVFFVISTLLPYLSKKRRSKVS